MKYYVTNNTNNGFNKIIQRVKSQDKQMYDSYKCYPIKILTIKDGSDIFDKDQRVLVFEGEPVEPVMRLLGFSFDLMFDNWERRIKEMEDFGRYRCIIYTDSDININEYDYTTEEV